MACAGGPRRLGYGALNQDSTETGGTWHRASPLIFPFTAPLPPGAGGSWSPGSMMALSLETQAWGQQAHPRPL